MFLPSLRKSLPASLAAGLFLCSAFTLVGQDSQAASHDHTVQVLRSLNRGRYLGQVAVSPDGKRLAWIQGAHEGAEIRVAPLDNLGKSERITAAATPDQRCSESDLTWSPDSAALAFLSDCLSSGDQTDLYLSHLNNSPARRLTIQSQPPADRGVINPTPGNGKWKAIPCISSAAARLDRTVGRQSDVPA